MKLIDEKKIGYIYKYTSPSGKVYIGQTTSSLEKRAGKDGIKYRGNRKGLFWKAIQKYGFENMKPEILHVEESKDHESLVSKLNILEKKYIMMYNSNVDGYNLTD